MIHFNLFGCILNIFIVHICSLIWVRWHILRAWIKNLKKCVHYKILGPKWKEAKQIKTKYAIMRNLVIVVIDLPIWGTATRAEDGEKDAQCRAPVYTNVRSDMHQCTLPVYTSRCTLPVYTSRCTLLEVYTNVGLLCTPVYTSGVNCGAGRVGS